MIRLDLHVHSSASDGTLSPISLLKEADRGLLSAISITDHDTVAAYETSGFDFKFYKSSLDLLLKTLYRSGGAVSPPVFIPGVELSVEFSGGALHILGYGINPFEKNLCGKLDALQRFRLDRNQKMTENLAREGFEITLDELTSEAGGELIARPHFAALMLKKGYVASYQEAFDRYLKKGAPFFMEKKRLEAEEAIELINGAGGIAVMAHPWQTGLDRDGIGALAADLKNKGLKGIEAYYSQHAKEERAFCIEVARKLDLCVSAGSDFHGTIKPHIPLGMTVPEEMVRPLLEALQARLLEIRL